MAKTVFVLLAVFSLLCLSCGQDTIAEGIVAHKVLSGTKDGVFYNILTNRFDDNGTPIVVLKDEDLQEYFPLEGDVTVSGTLESRILTLYSGVVYQVSVTESLERTVGYLTSREIFNRMTLGASVEYRASESSGVPKIVKLLD